MVDTIVYATIVQCAEEGEVGNMEILPNRVVGVKDGVVAWVKKEGEEGEVGDAVVVRVDPPGFLCPGLIDIHYHAPQDEYKGTGLDLPVMQWLDTYTFPAEKRMDDVKIAETEYARVVETTLRNGTTTCVYFATIHVDGSLELARQCITKGQRAFIGKVTMDRNSPEGYIESNPVGAVRDFLKEFPESDIVKPIITPRFLPTCTVETLKRLNEVRREMSGGLLVTTHVAESVDEVMFCDALEGRDLGVLRDCGLLDGAVLAHAVHLSDDELEMVRDGGGGIAHCPLSNCFFGHSIFRVADAMKLRVPVGLGTDVAGGYDPSMLSAIRHAVSSSHILTHGATDYIHTPHQKRFLSKETLVSYPQAFYLATLGSAKCLKLDSKLGTIAPGKFFDALAVDPTAAPYRIHLTPNDSVIEVFQKWLNLGDDRTIARVWVNGVHV
eukprot:TRINITY_DN15388_c0_g1_i1.p1 TRINITY_DN15388_c0_g1~~TRINITY_DN15388_c0_g1_i1.p1  ORF type:complete len:458 (+),score=62.84 TRINITY_DN15388_c0_g1_i1:60-1376(+)